mmetsp:Transcript_18950/g.44119  ORF Transcript_18950/g.44119 Transcript_18950/m.44119 type:complete len:233 (+) Transcript_18950:1410-2108(+)
MWTQEHTSPTRTEAKIVPCSQCIWLLELGTRRHWNSFSKAQRTRMRKQSMVQIWRILITSPFMTRPGTTGCTAHRYCGRKGLISTAPTMKGVRRCTWLQNLVTSKWQSGCWREPRVLRMAVTCRNALMLKAEGRWIWRWRNVSFHQATSSSSHMISILVIKSRPFCVWPANVPIQQLSFCAPGMNTRRIAISVSCPLTTCGGRRCNLALVWRITSVLNRCRQRFRTPFRPRA